MEREFARLAAKDGHNLILTAPSKVKRDTLAAVSAARVSDKDEQERVLENVLWCPAC